MEQNLSTDQKDFFSAIVANPEGIDAVHMPQLKTLVELFPQSGILRAMLARASQVYDQGGFQQKLKSAAVYCPDRAVLYNLINYPEKLTKYVEPFNEVLEEEPVGVFEGDYDSYEYDDADNGYEEETVYETEPVNYFHDPEEEAQHTFEDRTNYNPVAEPEVVKPGDEYISYNFSPAEPETVKPENEINAYNFPPAEPEAVKQENEINAYNFSPVEPVTEQPAVSGYSYTPPYREEEEDEELKAPPGYTYAKEIDPEPALPPIPDFDTTLSYQEQIANAATEIDEEVYDEISGIEDVYVEPIIKPKSNVPDITDIEEEELDVEEAEDEGEDVIMAQYGQQPANDVAEKPKLSKAEQELADFLAQGPQFTYTTHVAAKQVAQELQYTNNQPEPASYVAEQPQHTYTEPEPIAVEAEVYDEPEPIPVKEYITEHGVDIVEEDAPHIDEVDFEMVNEPAVAEPVKPIATIPTQRPAQSPIPGKAAPVQAQFANDDDGRVSKYNDEKMPYSFLWWLDKVRKEHAETHQPYVAFKPIISEVPRTAVSDELQQQYFENIFHITSVEQLDVNTRDKRKEGEIIDRFIQQDPQMKPPNTEKLDNENKAKKSAEDKNELVSETLARIYLDQMLYTKAIATYQKLMLKFPEKSSYFVAQIKLLEKKIN